jgi:membrane fusion protein, multidrug efflux system
LTLKLLITVAAAAYSLTAWPQVSGKIRHSSVTESATAATASARSVGASGRIRLPTAAVDQGAIDGGISPAIASDIITVQASASKPRAVPPLDLDFNMPRAGDPREIAVLIAADSEATLSSQMAARVKKVNFAIGQTFKPGDVLIEFDCDEQLAKLQSAEAEYLGARETHVTKLKLQGLGAAGELEVTLAAAAAEKAKSAVKQQQTQIAFCRINAPYPGQVARLRIKAFENVSIGQPLMEIVDQAKLKAVMHVPSTWLSWLKPGTPLKVKLAETGREHAGRVSKLNSRVDAVSQSIEIEATLDTKDVKILPGMIGTATFPGRGAGIAPSPGPDGKRGL